MADISGIVTLGITETPGATPVLLLNDAGDTIVASTTSHATTGAYSFTGLPGGVTYRVAVMGKGKWRSRVYGPTTTAVSARLLENNDVRVTETGDRRITEQ
jgi:hypothetical protein